MVWSDVFSRFTNARSNWRSNREEMSRGRQQGENRREGRCCCCTDMDQMSTEQVEESFTISQWHQLPHWLFVAFRCLAALYFSTWLVTSWISFKDTHKGGFSKWFVFITNWSFAMLVLQACALAWPVFKRRTNMKGNVPHGVTMEAILKEDAMSADNMKDVCLNDDGVESRGSEDLRLIHRLIWAFDNIASTMAIGVTVAFWTFLYNRQQPLGIVSVHTHGINAAYVMLDNLLCKRPRRIIHFYQPIIFGLLYVIFSVIYWSLGGTDPYGRHFVYTFLDWEKPSRSVIFALVFSVLSVALIYFFLYAVYRLRTLAYRRLCSSTGAKRTDYLDGKFTPISI